MRVVPTPIASKLTGLSTDKLREWTSRRALIPADQRPKTKGSPAKFSWHTVLVLRVAVSLRDHFGLELQAHKASFHNLRRQLQSQSFIALWGKRLTLGREGNWSILDNGGVVPEEDVLLISLDPHLVILRDGFALPDVSDEHQLDLFALPAGRTKSQALTAARPRTDRRAS